MRPLTETIASSGKGKKPGQISGLLPESGAGGVTGRQPQRNLSSATGNLSPRRGTFSLQNGYGYPVNGVHNSSPSPNYARHSLSPSTMDRPQQDFNVINGHRATSSTMSPAHNHKGSSSSYTNDISGVSQEEQHQHYSASNMLDIQCPSTDLDSFHEDDFRERFYVHETPSPTDSQCTSLHSGTASGDEEEEHPFFAGMRDVRHPETLKELKIVSSKGTIRGVKNRVKAGIATFLNQGDEAKKKNYRGTEKGRIVIYTTSMMIVRDTHEKCKKVKNILQTHMVKYEERDIFMSRENQRELCERLNNENVDVPQVFADGVHLGGANELEHFNESGELRRIFRHFRKISHASSCESCGGYRYIPCTVCHGSRKSVHRNHFTTEFCALRCIVCDENGLVKCDTCSEESTDNEKTKL